MVKLCWRVVVNNQERMRVRVCLCVSLWVNMADIVLFVLVIFTFLVFYIREQFDDLLSFELDNVILFCCSLTILPYMNIGINVMFRSCCFGLYSQMCSSWSPIIHSNKPENSLIKFMSPIGFFFSCFLISYAYYQLIWSFIEFIYAFIYLFIYWLIDFIALID